jgi:hypothetical protein
MLEGKFRFLASSEVVRHVITPSLIVIPPPHAPPIAIGPGSAPVEHQRHVVDNPKSAFLESGFCHRR